MFTEKTLRQFTDELATSAPVPGGGSAAALAAATGAGLVSMVCSLTLGKEKFRDVEAEMRQLLEQSEGLRREMLDLLEADTQVYSRVMSAYRLPRATDSEKQARSAAIQDTLKAACEVPMAIARGCAKIIDLCPAATQKGNVAAVSDAGVGAVLAAAALEGADLNVKINLASIKDEAFVAALSKELDQLLKTKLALKDEVLRQVLAKLGG